MGPINTITKNSFSKFFEYIWSKKPDALDWPDTSSTRYPDQNADIIEAVRKIMEEWRLQRHAYPGWLILPHGNRENLWLFTRSWANYLPETEKSLAGLDILYAFELLWRFERCLLPVFSNLAEFCEKLLEKYWPFHAESPNADYFLCAGEEKYQDLPWTNIREAWLAIALAMHQFYREKGHIEKWKKIRKSTHVSFRSFFRGTNEFHEL